ncbi:MAG: hypothetical protein AB1468_00795 [Candidatus Micrarchaeota archaeon]
MEVNSQGIAEYEKQNLEYAEKEIMGYIKEDPNLAVEVLKDVLFSKTRDAMAPDGSFSPQEKINAIAFLLRTGLADFELELSNILREALQRVSNGGVIIAERNVLEDINGGKRSSPRIGLGGGYKSLEKIMEKLAKDRTNPAIIQRKIARTFSRL